jgi:o-succinylbenzoate---CoA ligase
MERAELKAVVRATGCAIEGGELIFLADPNASTAERAQAQAQMAASAERENDGWLCVRTGGTGGVVKFVRHDEQTLGAAVRGFCAHFGLERVNAVGVLPQHHVSGLMARVRCAMTGGVYVNWDWKQLEAGHAPAVKFTEAKWAISLVPTQLQRLLSVRTPLRGVRGRLGETSLPVSVGETAEPVIDWLRKFHLIFLGGGPIWPELADAAARAGLRISLSYGMTETAAMVTALRPEEFLAGGRSAGTALPHARVNVDAADVITVAADSVFRGYYPEWRDSREFTTEDIGAIDARGHLHVLGRRDAMIITGGKKVQPADVETALRASGEFEDVAVIGVPDHEWGEAVVACYPKSAARVPDIVRAVEKLAPHQRPKRFVPLADWPRNAQGKLNRAALRAAAIARAQDDDRAARIFS